MNLIFACRGTQIISMDHHSGHVGNSEIWVFSDLRNGANGMNNGGKIEICRGTTELV